MKQENGVETPAGRPDGSAIGQGSKSGSRMFQRVLASRLPLWVTIIVLGAVSAGFGIVLAARTSVDLGPALDGAREARVSLTICNEIVDRREINPRAAELALESGLRHAGVEEPDVAIERIDCGPAVTAPAPAG